MGKSETSEVTNFSIVLGGPFFQLLHRFHLVGDALELVKLRTIVLAMVAWLPLFLLSMLKGQAWGDDTHLPFIEDFEVHIRFLLALPLMIAAELVVHQRMLLVVNQFHERKLIPEIAIDKFHKAMASAFRMRNSIVAEILMVVTIYVIGYNVVWQESMALHTTAWFSEPTVGRGNLSFAGIWFRYVSLPIFQFLFLRWYYRMFIWGSFLFQVSRIKLQLLATHPDHVGGLGFLSNSVYAFMPLAVAHGAVLSGMIANHIFHQGAALLDFKVEIMIIGGLVMLVVILPLFSFSSQLAEAKRTGSLEYGKLASRFVKEFETRWIRGSMPDREVLVGTSDIQSLADLANSYKVVLSMQVVPITRGDLILLAVMTLAPVIPLVLTMMPLSELIKILSGVLL